MTGAAMQTPLKNVCTMAASSCDPPPRPELEERLLGPNALPVDSGVEDNGLPSAASAGATVPDVAPPSMDSGSGPWLSGSDRKVIAIQALGLSTWGVLARIP